MSDAKSPQNLSMDEILATIRRIIAEDEQSSSTPSTTAARGVPAAARPASVPPVPVSDERAAGTAQETAQTAAETAGADDVLDLTDALNEDGSVRHLAPLATVADATEPEPLHALPMAPPEPARTLPFAERAAGTMAVEAVPVEVKPADTGPNTALASDPGPALPSATRSGATDERLISEAAASAAATAFGRLAAAPRARQDPPLVGDRPLDEIVRELLRPLLRTWLDEHLPGIVERLVRAEIDRISARSEPG
jgi:cell pole-organizing protein PopZ